MSNTRLKKPNSWSPELQRTILFGFVLRLVLLITMIYLVDDVWDIFFIEDDKKYEELAASYMFNARGIWDMNLFETLTLGYAKSFWPFVMCVSGKLFNTEFAGRFINIVLSTFCIPLIHNLTYLVADNEKTALRAAKLFAFMPITILTSCFPIKDIFLTLSILYAFYTFVTLQSGRGLTVGRIVVCAALLIAVSFTRGAVTELMLIFLAIYYMQKLLREKKYLAGIFFLTGAAIIFLLAQDSIIGSFETKIDTYSNYGADEAAGLNAIRVTSAADFYKLPFAYAFASLQPMKLELFTIGADTRPWRTVMSYANIAMYPAAVGNFLYLFSKKHNLFFWLSSFVMFSAVIILSLGVFRHYLFLLPITLINHALYMDEGKSNVKNHRTLVIVGTFALFILVFCYSLVKMM